MLTVHKFGTLPYLLSVDTGTGTGGTVTTEEPTTGRELPDLTAKPGHNNPPSDTQENSRDKFDAKVLQILRTKAMPFLDAEATVEVALAIVITEYQYSRVALSKGVSVDDLKRDVKNGNPPKEFTVDATYEDMRKAIIDVIKATKKDGDDNDMTDLLKSNSVTVLIPSACRAAMLMLNGIVGTATYPRKARFWSVPLNPEEDNKKGTVRFAVSENVIRIHKVSWTNDQNGKPTIDKREPNLETILRPITGEHIKILYDVHISKRPFVSDDTGMIMLGKPTLTEEEKAALKAKADAKEAADKAAKEASDKAATEANPAAAEVTGAAIEHRDQGEGGQPQGAVTNVGLELAAELDGDIFEVLKSSLDKCDKVIDHIAFAVDMHEKLNKPLTAVQCVKLVSAADYALVVLEKEVYKLEGKAQENVVNILFDLKTKLDSLVNSNCELIDQETATEMPLKSVSA